MDKMCFCLSFLCLAYELLIYLYAGKTVHFAYIWLIFGAALLLFGGVLRHNAKMAPGKLCVSSAFVFFLIGAAFLFIAFFMIRIVRECVKETDGELEYVVVLGAQVKGKVPSRSLTMRLNTALQYAERNPETILILSGGKGDGEDISEAECMEGWLVSHGVDPGRLILEVNSTSTRENLIFSDTLTGCSQSSCGLVTNDFHIYRSLLTARREGYQNVHGIAASSDRVLWVHLAVRECFSLARDEALYGLKRFKEVAMR